MRIELRVDRNGQTIFRAECDTERGSSFAEFSKLALKEFSQRQKCRCSMMTFGSNSIRFDVQRPLKAPDGQAHDLALAILHEEIELKLGFPVLGATSGRYSREGRPNSPYVGKFLTAGQG